jgi:hypothetical protein
MSFLDWLEAEGSRLPEPTTITTWPAPGRLATVGERRAVRWLDFVSQPLHTPLPKDALPAWSPATFRGDRRGLAHHERSTALVFDVDAHTPVATLLERLRAVPFASHVHTSPSATADVLRWRVIFELEGTASAAEHETLWRWGAESLGLEGIDRAPKHAASLFYVPVQRPGGLYVWRSFPGFRLPVDEVLKLMTPAPVAPMRLAKSGGGASALERARRYLRGVPGAIAGQRGHDATFYAALCAVLGFCLSDEEALAVMDEWNARCTPPWSKRELARKIREAREKGQLPNGFLLNDERRRA